MPALIRNRVSFRRALFAWYRRRRRRLPWREEPSLYKTAVAEFMLQQTQVKTALPYFDRWLRALPGFAALAAAPESRVLKLWEGLGYYARARNLRLLAKALIKLPALPRDPAAWRELPGVGPYTAAAIASIAFHAPAACVDGNVVRILARLTADDTRFGGGADAAKHFTPLADALLARDDPGAHNQAMMELGATVCLRHAPCCPDCPVRRFCAAANRGNPLDYPRFVQKKIERRSVTRVWCEHREKLLLHRAEPEARRLAGLHELPATGDIGLTEPRVQTRPLLLRKTRAIANHRITESIYAVSLAAAQRRGLAANPALRWVPLAALDRITLSGPHRRWILEILQSRSHSSAVS